MASSFTRFLDHTQWRITSGRTPLDEWSARRRDLYLTTHNTHNRQTSMPPVGFKPTISAGERPQTYALDRAAIGTGCYWTYRTCYLCPISFPCNAGKWVDIFRIQCDVNFLQAHLCSSDSFSLRACSSHPARLSALLQYTNFTRWQNCFVPTSNVTFGRGPYCLYITNRYNYSSVEKELQMLCSYRALHS